jgi:hypothetical protein
MSSLKKSADKLILTGVFLSGLITTAAFGRSPAVLPVMELSIEEYNKIGPDQAKSPGHDFSTKGTAQVLIPVQNNIVQNNIVQTNNVVSDEGTIVQNAIEKHAMMNLRSISTYLILLMMSLPAIAWLYMAKQPLAGPFPQAPDQTTGHSQQTTDLSNVTTLPKRAGNTEKTNDVKKAS